MKNIHNFEIDMVIYRANNTADSKSLKQEGVTDSSYNVLFQDNESGQEDFSDSDSDIPDELKQDYIDELTGETHNRY